MVPVNAKGVKCGRGNYGGNKPSISGTVHHLFILCLGSIGGGRCAMVEKVA